GGHLWSGLFFGLQGKIAVGNNHEIYNIDGQTTTFPLVGVPTTVPGGFFTRQTNTGRFERGRFAYVPEGEAKIGYQVNRNFMIFVGYDYFFWHQAARPGEQIVRKLPPLGTPATTTPLIPFNQSDFSAEGVDVGFELRY